MAITYQRADGAVGTSMTLDIGAASNDRLVVVVTGNEGTGNALSAVTVDGKSCTLVTRADNDDSAGNETEMWYITESGLGSSAGSVTISITGGDAGFAVHAMLFYGVPDAAPTDYEVDDSSVSVATSTITNVTTTDDDIVIYVASHGLSQPWISRTSPLNMAHNSDDPSSARMECGYGIETTGQTNKTYVITSSVSHNRASGIAAVWADSGGSPPSGNPWYYYAQQ